MLTGIVTAKIIGDSDSSKSRRIVKATLFSSAFYYAIRTRLVILCEKYDRRKISYDRDKREPFIASNYTILKRKKNAIRIH